MLGETTNKYIQNLIKKAAGEAGQFSVSEPKDASFGDYASNAALILSKQLKKNPQDVAADLVGKFTAADLENRFSEIYEKAGFINFRLSPDFLLARLSEINSQKDKFGHSDSGKNKKILVEYFQPNVAKPLHLGHLRTAIIGDSIFKILSCQGYKTESDTHLGDWGTQFGLLIYAYKTYGNPEKIKKDPINQLNSLYIRANKESENNPNIREQGKAEFVKLEQGDGENRQLWKQFRDWSWKEYGVVYDDLGIRKPDHDWPESFYEDKMPAVINQLKEKGLLEVSQGAQIINLEKYNLGIALVIKSDGGTTYLLRDLATYIYRKSQGFEKQIYVVDVRQKHQLAQTFKILELLGHIQSSDEAIHIAYGFLTLPEGAMSTRKGTVVGAAEFIKSVGERALEIIKEKNPDLKNKNEVAKVVATAAIKYFDLSHNLKSDIVFDPKAAISFEGKTGPYLQYTHARIHGILRKTSVVIPDATSPAERDAGNPESINKIPASAGMEINDGELAVLRKLNQFPEIVEIAARDFLPNIICNYLFELSQLFNSFYESSPVLQEPDEKIKSFRLRLITAAAQVIKNGLYLLGIEAPEEM